MTNTRIRNSLWDNFGITARVWGRISQQWVRSVICSSLVWQFISKWNARRWFWVDNHQILCCKKIEANNDNDQKILGQQHFVRDLRTIKVVHELKVILIVWNYQLRINYQHTSSSGLNYYCPETVLCITLVVRIFKLWTRCTLSSIYLA